MKIYTRTGDQGETGLLGSVRVPKDHLRITAYGEIDELNAQIGSLRSTVDETEILSLLAQIQNLLFEIGAELARPAAADRPRGSVGEDDVAVLERAIDRLEEELPPLRQFLLPGGGEAACRAHLARCVCRRAERAVVRLLRAEPSETAVLRYVNRLSDLLFVLARRENRRAGVAELVWESRASGGGRQDMGGPGRAS